jgi:hypothetical protein
LFGAVYLKKRVCLGLFNECIEWLVLEFDLKDVICGYWLGVLILKK